MKFVFRPDNQVQLKKGAKKLSSTFVRAKELIYSLINYQAGACEAENDLLGCHAD